MHAAPYSHPFTQKHHGQPLLHPGVQDPLYGFRSFADKDIPGYTISRVRMRYPSYCALLCKDNDDCGGFVMSRGYCNLKDRGTFNEGSCTSMPGAKTWVRSDTWVSGCDA